MTDLEKQLVSVFKSGVKEKHGFSLGVETEHFVTDKKKNRRVYYDDGVENLLEEASAFFEDVSFFGDRVASLGNKNYVVTLEPSAQFEVSIRPCENISEIENIYNDFLSVFTPLLKKHGFSLEMYGYSRNSLADDCKIIPKERYRLMNGYFKSLGNTPQYMMRQTCATQVSIDYFSEKDFVDKLRLASVLSPILYLVSENSPVTECKKTDNHCPRIDAWRKVDDTRTGIIRNIFDDDFSFEKLAEFYSNISPIFIFENGREVFTGKKTAREIFENKTVTDENVNHLLSMAFFDSRVKNFIEIRSADSMPVEFTLAYCSLIKGVFSNENTVKSLLDFANCKTTKEIENAKTQVALFGYEAEVYGKNAKQFAEFVIENAKNNLNESEKKYILLLENCVKSGKSVYEFSEETDEISR